ncbi:sulfur reduction protein DsrS [Thiocystis minor]|uniref:sulfur reduction protein DsrS n=1 Tax=Thiocystis minor TaxID=61597 RepID=UPI001912C063|nr:sulfur reduction protein DsrS [Thiocystis minor]MBK5963701.1 sulfur reduction protein DsrS [Thiocystis minor]
MDLSPEDTLRLNVLLANQPQAIRIDESRMIVQSLGVQGEVTIRLNPNTRADQYLRRVRELLSGHVLGSPGGYPIYLQRWTRMGQMRDESLAQLLLLGEPEAVVAAVCAPGLTDELARRAWWAMEDAGNARRMLSNLAVARSAMGQVLAEYLIEYLPFETESEAIVESVRLVLQPGLLDREGRGDLWRKAARKPSYLVGFLQALPDDLPEPAPARALAGAVHDLAGQGDAVAVLLQRVYSERGQAFLKTVAAVLAKPPSQDVVLATFVCLREYFAVLRPAGDPDLAIDDLLADATRFANPDRAYLDVAKILLQEPLLASEIAAMRFLSGVGYGLIRPILPDSTTLGSLMRRKLAPVIIPLQDSLDRLRRISREFV